MDFKVLANAIDDRIYDKSLTLNYFQYFYFSSIVFEILDEWISKFPIKFNWNFEFLHCQHATKKLKFLLITQYN